MLHRILCTALACVLLLAATGTAEARKRDKQDFKRWGVGWDNGIAMRYLLSPTWGLGFQIRPQFSDEDSDDLWVTTPQEPDPPSLRQTFYANKSKYISVGFLIYREHEISDWLGVGPYLRLLYDRNTSDRSSVQIDRPQWTQNTDTSEQFLIELGIRPTFRFDDRFVLESRFGIGLSHRRVKYSGTSHYENSSQSSSRDSERTSFHSFGQNLGPGSVLQFIIYF